MGETHYWPADVSSFYYETPARRVFGFGFSRYTDMVTVLVIPYWFLPLPFALLSCFVWRKTRPPTAKRAFPVELSPPTAAQNSKVEGGKS